jgi:hypothetical protein
MLSSSASVATWSPLQGGAGHGIDADCSQTHESALKEAETDATKRALMTFGNAFGLALYDKQQRQVSDAKAVAAPQKQPPHQPLSPVVITALQERIKALKPTARASFSTAFRAAFQVPPEQPSLAALITTTRHQRWIEAFLAEAERPARMGA